MMRAVHWVLCSLLSLSCSTNPGGKTTAPHTEHHDPHREHQDPQTEHPPRTKEPAPAPEHREEDCPAMACQYEPCPPGIKPPTGCAAVCGCLGHPDAEGPAMMTTPPESVQQ